MIRHGSPSCDEDRLGLPEQPSNSQCRAGHLTRLNREHTILRNTVYLININFNTEGANGAHFEVDVNGLPASVVSLFPTSYSHMSKTFVVLLSEADAVQIKSSSATGVRFDGGGGIYDNVVIMRTGVG